MKRNVNNSILYSRTFIYLSTIAHIDADTQHIKTKKTHCFIFLSFLLSSLFIRINGILIHINSPIISLTHSLSQNITIDTRETQTMVIVLYNGKKTVAVIFSRDFTFEYVIIYEKSAFIKAKTIINIVRVMIHSYQSHIEIYNIHAPSAPKI